MYQEIRFVNQDACFFKSRRETTVFDQLCFREGLKTRTQVGASDPFYIPNASEVFEGLLSLLQHCRDCVKENTDGGHAEFLARRQEEYQRPLCDLWVTWSSYGVGPGESAYSGFGAINAGNGLQITITCKTKQ